MSYSIAGKQVKFNSADDIKSYCDEIIAFDKLVSVDFSGNTLGVEASEALSKALLHHKDTITEINFSDLYTGRLNTEIPQSLEYLLPALLQMPNLKTVNLSDNAFGLQTIDPIEAYLTKAVSVQHLILSNNGMGPFAGARIGTSLFKLAQAKKAAGVPSLKTFVCGRNRLENGSINHLALGLRSHADLEVVRLYQNGIRPAGIAKLVADGLSQNKNLTVLDLQDNTITKGSTELAAALTKGWDKLQEINFNDALLKNTGSLAVAKALASKPRPDLNTLKLQYNELESDALKVLAEGIKEHLPNLTWLELNGNRFEEDSEHVEAIAEVFAERGKGEIDDLDDLEEIDSEEEDDDEDADDALEKDLNLDDLAKELGGADVDELTEGLKEAHLE